jgi:hypothetical protein
LNANNVVARSTHHRLLLREWRRKRGKFAKKQPVEASRRSIIEQNNPSAIVAHCGRSRTEQLQ